MNTIQVDMLQEAIEKYNDIEPTSGRNWDGCFTKEEGMNIFWFNTLDGSTRVIIREEEE